MGIQQAGIIGPFRNKVGPTAGRRHMGQDLLISLPDTNNKPATAKQLKAQLFLGLLNGFLSRIDKLVNPGFKAFTKHNSPVNAAFKYNHGHAFVKDGEAWQINYPKMVYSRGHIVAPYGAQVVSTEGKITFSWPQQNQSAYCQYTDMASFLIYNPAKEMAIILRAAVSRNTQSFEIQMPVDFSGDTVHCYLSFASANGKIQGDSLYVGAVEVV